MLTPRVLRFLRIQRLATSLSGVCFGVIISVLANWLSQQWVRWLPLVIAVGTGAAIVGILSYLRQRQEFEVAIGSPLTIRSPEDARLYARQGFVGYVPLYTPKYGTDAARLSVEERVKAVEALDFDRLKVAESNLQPTIEAIRSHKTELKHCWLLATRGAKEKPGSLPYPGF